MAKEVIKEIKILKWTAVISLLVMLFLGWFFWLDVKFNPVLEFTNGVDPLNLQLTKPSYKVGEMVQGYSSFCKLRESESATRWNLVNGHLTTYTIGEYKALPTGCYPENEGELIIFDIKRVPEDATIGDQHYFVANSYQRLTFNRENTIQYKTETFLVER